MADTFFKKRAEANDLGRDYENVFIANIVLDLVADDEIDEFEISSNDDHFGVFDDVVLEVKPRGKVPNFFAFQLKHSERRRLTLDSLNVGKDFRIKKYFENYKELVGKNIPYFYSYKLVIFTNRNFHMGEDSRIRLKGEDFDIKILKCKPEPLLVKYSTEGDVYRLECDDNSEKSTKFQKFFDNFLLYTNQYNVGQFERNVFDKFQQKFHCDETLVVSYLNFVTQWSKKGGRKVKLKKSMMKQAIAICLFSPFIRTVSPSLDDEEPRSVLLLQSIYHFDVTHCAPSNFDLIRKLLGRLLTGIEDQKMNAVGKKFQINPGSRDKVAWLMDLCPLVVEGNVTVYEGLKLCDHKPVIVLTDSRTSDSSVFQCLSNLKTHPSLYEEVLDTFVLQLQGKEAITLRRFVGQSDEIEDLITTSHLLQMTQGPLKIGEDKTDLPLPYIGSHLTRHIIDNAFLEDVDLDETMIINSDGHGDFLFDFEIDQKFFDSLCYDKPKAHQFRMFEGKLEWIRSKGKIDELKKFQSTEYFVEESKVLSIESDNNVNIVCADAGMGKTTFLKSLKNNYPSEFWTILICPKDHSRHFRQNGDDVGKFLRYILEKTCGRDSFLRKLLAILKKKRKINFLWDGLDETSHQNLNIVISIIDKLAGQGFRQWITSRRNLKSALEDKFNVLARTLKQFGEEEQKNYIKDKLKCSEEEIDRWYDRISRNMQLFRYNEILGVPLQMYMFTELLLQNLEKYNNLLDDVFSLADLFKHFVEERFNVHHRDKECFQESNDAMCERNKEFDDEHTELYQKAAIKLHFPTEVLKKLKNVECDSFLEKIRKGKDPLGIITYVSEENVPDFYHSSYGEYFAALYVYENRRRIPKLADFIFDSKYDNIRFFFDLILAKDCPAHLAVLYKNVQVLKECSDTEINSVDKEGRYPIHLACSWGERYPLLPTETYCFWFMCSRVVMVEPRSVKKDNPEYREILEFLSKRNDPNQTDALFKMNSFSYCDKSRRLLPYEILSTTRTIKQVSTLLYYASVLDFSNILDNLKPLPLLTAKEANGYETILFVAVKHDSVNFLKKILSFRNYRNVAMDNYSTLLIRAVKHGNCDILKLLIDTLKVDIHSLGSLLFFAIENTTHNYTEIVPVLIEAGARVSTRMLQCACAKNQYAIAKLLISNGARADDKTLLRLASERNFYEIAQLLLENGANVREGNPLSAAAAYRNYHLCRLLISHGAYIDEEDANGMTLLHFVCQDGELELLELLVEKGAHVDVRSKKGERPLHLASRRGRCRVVEVLVDARAQIDCVDDEGLTPLHVACACGHLRTVEVLIQRGAKVNSICYNDETALDKATDDRICDLLKRNNGVKRRQDM